MTNVNLYDRKENAHFFKFGGGLNIQFLFIYFIGYMLLNNVIHLVFL